MRRREENEEEEEDEENDRRGRVLTRSCRIGSLISVALCSAIKTKAVRYTDWSTVPATWNQSENLTVNTR